MKICVFAVLINFVFISFGNALTTYCSTKTCSWDNNNFCATSGKWCSAGFANDLGTGIYKYCVPQKGYYQGQPTNTTKIICYSDQSVCKAIATMAVPFSGMEGDVYWQPAKGYFAGCSQGNITTSDVYSTTYACGAGYYSRYGVFAAVSTDSPDAKLGCSSCGVGYYSTGVAVSCTQCPSASDIYTDSSLQVLARGTVAGGSGVSQESCYLSAGTYYDSVGRFTVEDKKCTY